MNKQSDALLYGPQLNRGMTDDRLNIKETRKNTNKIFKKRV